MYYKNKTDIFTCIEEIADNNIELKIESKDDEKNDITKEIKKMIEKKIVNNPYIRIPKFNNSEITAIIDSNGIPWFSGRQIAKSLGYKDPKRAILYIVNKKYKTRLNNIVDDSAKLHPYSQLHTVYINESGLNELLANSKLDTSKKFKLWIHEELIPSINKLCNGYQIEVT